MLAVRLLGPVTACIDDVALRLTRPLERALLARLALSPGLAVEAPRPFDELWTAAPDRGWGVGEGGDGLPPAGPPGGRRPKPVGGAGEPRTKELPGRGAERGGEDT